MEPTLVEEEAIKLLEGLSLHKRAILNYVHIHIAPQGTAFRYFTPDKSKDLTVLNLMHFVLKQKFLFNLGLYTVGPYRSQENVVVIKATELGFAVHEVCKKTQGVQDAIQASNP
jgi:hypothetical protein